jgi:hypothetical protein
MQTDMSPFAAWHQMSLYEIYAQLKSWYHIYVSLRLGTFLGNSPYVHRRESSVDIDWINIALIMIVKQYNLCHILLEPVIDNIEVLRTMYTYTFVHNIEDHM